jgi:flagellar biosynthesis/type III secretory pathway M-ring protein FliF/YscJ
MYAAMLLAAATPEPSAPPPELVTPGPWGFAVIAFVAAAVFLLVWDMLRRIRRGRYREEVNEELDAAEAQARAAEEASDVDDQDIDPRDDDAPDIDHRDAEPDRR